MNGNELVPKHGSSGLIAADYISDSTNTTLLDFNVNLDNFIVILYFSETVASDTSTLSQMRWAPETSRLPMAPLTFLILTS